MLDLRQAALISAFTAAICIAVYRQIGSSLKDVQHTPEEHTFISANAGVEAKERKPFSKPPYPINAFPGSRQFKSVYGTIQVFEWGPEDGEKVLLVHGLGTPCIALGDMAKELVGSGYRVMIYDLFGRGYSDAPNDLAYDARLYTTQILLVLSSSPLSWTGTSAFHIIGFSLGGSIAVAFAAYHATMVRSMTLVCPGGLIRTSHISTRNRFLYSSSRIIPEWLRLKLFRDSLEPRNGAPCADVPEEYDEVDWNFDEVPIAVDRPDISIGDVIRWQLAANAGFVHSYLSTLRSALVYRRHDTTWKVLADELAYRRAMDAPPGLGGGKVCLIVAQKDAIVVGDECEQDAMEILGMEAVETYVLSGGHEIAISRGKDVALMAIEFWNRR
ncbi:putative Alpha hydrolase [Venustampulla echinocandica]|uniref:Putative Alpha hydrolase n=1 Tax=Venustampulla echinocandica TaxID=2656787 RepID=A0A370TAR2_9HELO|nr:putative Alpha hydrolase [Venustampulla echinocandica]RDL31025.1 putative Alpha hydrolase [Venustampulla echinocandica]